jgi:hypothetical protein
MGWLHTMAPRLDRMGLARRAGECVWLVRIIGGDPDGSPPVHAGAAPGRIGSAFFGADFFLRYSGGEP